MPQSSLSEVRLQMQKEGDIAQRKGLRQRHGKRRTEQCRSHRYRECARKCGKKKGAWSKEKACSKGMAKDGECGVYGRSCSGVPPKDKELKLGAKQRKTPVDVGEVAKAKDNKTCI